MFARAWNNRDADALASLFDEDAEFVNVTGLCWHNREAIRKAHAFGLEGLSGNSTLATGETKVKLLSPDVAVVHAHMTLSGDAPAGDDSHPLWQTDGAPSLVIDEVERIWSAIDRLDDWSALEEKISGICDLGRALGEPPVAAGHRK